MSVVSPLVLLVLGALIHGSTALQCYECHSEDGQACDDPLDTTKVNKVTCAANETACGKSDGTAKIHDSLSSTGVGRGCAAKSEDMCKQYNNEPVPEFEDVSAYTGEICYCTTDLCNSAPQTSIGHLTVSFIGAVSLLALTTTRLLSE